MKYYLYGLILGIIVITVNCGCLPVSTENTEEIETSKLTLIESHIETECPDLWYIVGTIKNITDSELTYAQISFNLYDKEGNQVGTTSDNIIDLEAHGTWKFKAIVIMDTASDYKLKELSGD